MKNAIHIIAALMIVQPICGQSSPAAQPTSNVVELPRPNSGTYTFAEAEAKKHLILSNQPSAPLKDWKNPYFGFAIHVSRDDRFMIYSVSPDVQNEGMAPKRAMTVKEVQEFQRTIIQLGNPHGVLVTSDLPLKQSKTFPELLKVLFVPRIQIFYAQQP